MKLLPIIFIGCLFSFSLIGTCAIASDVEQKIEMKSESGPPELIVLQQRKDGTNQIVEDVPEEYPAVIPYFLDYIQKNIGESKQAFHETKISALAITYGYPDNLEINLLSGEREKIVKKIRPDEKLHELRIRNAMVMINFIRDETGGISSNAVVGFQLFPKDIDYSGMNIVPDYELQKGSWTITWEKMIQVRTEVYVGTDTTVSAAIRAMLTAILKTGEVIVIGLDGQIAHTVWPVWIFIGLREEMTKPLMPHLPEKQHRLCRCWNIVREGSPVQPEQRIPCGQPFRVAAGEACPNNQGCSVCE